MPKRIGLATLFISNLFALPLQVVDTCPDLSVPICANGSGDFELYANANGEENGGEYHAVWIIIFASW